MVFYAYTGGMRPASSHNLDGRDEQQSHGSFRVESSEESVCPGHWIRYLREELLAGAVQHRQLVEWEESGLYRGTPQSFSTICLEQRRLTGSP